mmetsp:Transcript_38273/g.68433  ORF Transcript_38273/g.68433 Transcript_38273/m.68433 type:complete len:263 (-) Transcript_38273:142-930(-)
MHVAGLQPFGDAAPVFHSSGLEALKVAFRLAFPCAMKTFFAGLWHPTLSNDIRWPTGVGILVTILPTVLLIVPITVLTVLPRPLPLLAGLLKEGPAPLALALVLGFSFFPLPTVTAILILIITFSRRSIFLLFVLEDLCPDRKPSPSQIVVYQRGNVRVVVLKVVHVRHGAGDEDKLAFVRRVESAWHINGILRGFEQQGVVAQVVELGVAQVGNGQDEQREATAWHTAASITPLALLLAFLLWLALSRLLALLRLLRLLLL